MQTFRIEGEAFERLGKLVSPNYKRKLMSEFGIVAVNFSKERFIKKDWKDQVSEKWTPRKRKERGSLLAKTGRLKRSIRKIGSGLDYVIIGSDVPYAKIHNEGGTTQKSVYVSAHSRTSKRGRSKVKSHTRKINLRLPKRQFMGSSRALNIRLQKHLKQSFTEILNKL